MDNVNDTKNLNITADVIESKISSGYQKKLDDIIYIIRRKWLSITHPFRYFYKSVSNIIRWIPILWKDRDWDHAFIYEILQFKLKNQSEYIRKADVHTMSQYDADKMTTCVRLIEKIKNETYCIEYFDYEKSNYNWKNVPGKKDLMELEIEHVQENLQDFLDKHKSAYKRMWHDKTFRKGLREENDCDMHRKAMYLSDYNHYRSKKLLFRIMQTHIEGWWD